MLTINKLVSAFIKGIEIPKLKKVQIFCLQGVTFKFKRIKSGVTQNLEETLFWHRTKTGVINTIFVANIFFGGLLRNSKNKCRSRCTFFLC